LQEGEEMITLKLKLGDQDIELTMEEARNLYDELCVIFSKNPMLPYPNNPPILYRADATETPCRG